MKPLSLVLASLVLSACTHDFGAFSVVDGAGTSADRSDAGVAVDAAPEEAGSDTAPAHDSAVPDATCTPSAACLATAKSCAQGCDGVEQSCLANCGNNGCRQNCKTALATCKAACNSTCLTCTTQAGCASSSACAAAAM